MIQILIVHEVRLIANLTASALRMQPNLEVVACVATAGAALTLLRQSACDVILVSATLPQNGAATLMRTVAQRHHTSKVLITGVVAAKTVILRWLEAGATGYVHTDESVDILVQKIRSATHGECLLSPAMVATLLTRVNELKQQLSALNSWQVQNTATLYSELTRREYEVLDLIEQRYSNQGISKALTIELGTVKNHVHNIMAKLGVRNRDQAASVARQALIMQLSL
ncbi:MAG: response regulator transcription factor [Chloroflexi bacterium]|nr:response regulator transcription factor [Chloroflexota bacterium]